MKAAKIRFRFDDGAVFEVDEARAVGIRVSQLSRYAVALAEATQAKEEGDKLLAQIERDRLNRIAADGRKAIRDKAAPIHDAIIDDYKRFVAALRSYERIKLGPLLTEFSVPKAKWATFGPRNIASTLARKHGLTATQIRAILRAAKKQAKAR